MKMIEMRFEGIVQKHVAGANPKAPAAPTLFITAGKNDGRIGTAMAMARNALARRPAFPAGCDVCEPSYRLLPVAQLYLRLGRHDAALLRVVMRQAGSKRRSIHASVPCNLRNCSLGRSQPMIARTQWGTP